MSSGDDATDAAVLKGRLLVVDDDASNRDMLSRRLTRMGHSVDTADSGTMALRKLRSGGSAMTGKPSL